MDQQWQLPVILFLDIRQRFRPFVLAFVILLYCTCRRVNINHRSEVCHYGGKDNPRGGKGKKMEFSVVAIDFFLCVVIFESEKAFLGYSDTYDFFLRSS